MKAVRVHRFGGPDVLNWQDIAVPEPGNGQVLIQAKAIGVNPVDTYIRAGQYGERPLPFTPGFDAAGVVERVGNAVKAFKPGDRVYIRGSVSGAYAERILCDENQVYSLASTLSFEQGAAIGVPYGTAYFAIVHRGQAQKGETVLVHGASGGVGSAAVQIAKDLGLRVFGTAGTPEGEKLVRQEGADEVFNHRQADYLDQILKKTDGKGVDLILEMLANVNLGKDLKILAPHGRVVVIGSRGPVEIDPRDMFVKHTDIRGLSLLSVSAEEIAKIHKALGEKFLKGTLKPVIGRHFLLAQAPQAHEAILAPGAQGKIVLVP